jgi:hypothetical protein
LRHGLKKPRQHSPHHPPAGTIDIVDWYALGQTGAGSGWLNLIDFSAIAQRRFTIPLTT